ncbi:LuxR family transcriptional regulator [Ktedonobacteria bacterium brp13]|nr:LuxR family transcriptional regulator [Ktedonobacteria bacterium brp13]
MLNRGLERKLTLVAALPGAGKSTLLSSWYTSLQQRAIAVSWISLEEQDNDPSNFWSLFMSAFQHLLNVTAAAFDTKPTSTLSASSSHQSNNIAATVSSYALATLTPETLLSTILQALHALPTPPTLPTQNRPLVLILDDYHVITTQAIHQAISLLIEHLPPQLHLVISTHHDPPFIRPRLRMQGQLMELRTDHLRFTPEEAGTFFQQSMHLQLTPNDIEMLMTRTIGLVAVLQLVALGLQDQPDRTQFIASLDQNHDTIMEYLATEILSRQTIQVQHFLLTTSQLDHFSASLCDAILQHHESQAILTYLKQARLFLIPLDEHQQWYRYHPLFADFLREQYAHPQHPQTDQPYEPYAHTNTTIIHQRAGEWFEQQNNTDEAINHFLLAQNFTQAAQLIRQYSTAMIRRGEITLLLRWLGALPEEFISIHPDIILYYTVALIASEQLAEADLRMHMLEQLQTAEQLQVSFSTLPQSFSTILSVVRVTLAGFHGDIEKTIALAKQANENMAGTDTSLQSTIAASLATAYFFNGCLNEANTYFHEAEILGRVSKHPHEMITGICGQGYILLDTGHLFQAAARFQPVLQAHYDRVYASLGMAYLGIGEIYYYWNEIDKAETALQQGIELGLQWGFPLPVIRGALFLIRVKIARGNVQQAEALIQRLEQRLLHETYQERSHLLLGALRAELFLAHNDIEQALHWAQSTGVTHVQKPMYIEEFLYLALIDVYIAANKVQPALAWLEQIQENALDKTRCGIDMQTRQAIIYYKQGRLNQAQHLLMQTLLLAQPEHIIRIFTDRGEPIKALLLRLLSTYSGESEDYRIYLHTLLNVLDQQTATVPTQLTPTVILSEREQKVLALLAHGLSNQQIATTLVIAPSTVKWYLKQIYTKLNAHNRVQALANAQKLHLIS